MPRNGAVVSGQNQTFGTRTERRECANSPHSSGFCETNQIDLERTFDGRTDVLEMSFPARQARSFLLGPRGHLGAVS